MTSTFNHHQHTNHHPQQPSLASKNKSTFIPNQRSSSRQNHPHQNIQTQPSPPQIDRSTQPPTQRNLRSSVFLLNGVLNSSELDLSSSDHHPIIKSLDRPNRSNTRPTSWILMQDGLYGPPQKQPSSHHLQPKIDLYDETLLSDSNSNSHSNSHSNSNSKTSFIHHSLINPSDHQIKSQHPNLNDDLQATLTSSSSSKKLINSNPSSLTQPNQSTTSNHQTSSYSPLAAFLGATNPSISNSKSINLSSSTSSTNLIKSSNSTSLLATFFNSGNQSASTQQIHTQTASPQSRLIDQTASPESRLIDHTKLDTVNPPSKPQSTLDHLSKQNSTNDAKRPSKETNGELPALSVRLEDSPKHVQIPPRQEDQIKLSNDLIQRSHSHKSNEPKHITTSQEADQPKPRSEKSNQSIKPSISQPHHLITPPMTPMKSSEPIKVVEPIHHSITNKYLGPSVNRITRPSSTEECQSVKNLPIESQTSLPVSIIPMAMNSKAHKNMKRPVTSVYIEEDTEEVYHSEQDGRSSTLSSPSTDTNSTRSETFPITPNSERMRPEPLPSSKPIQTSLSVTSNEEEEEEKEEEGVIEEEEEEEAEEEEEEEAVVEVEPKEPPTLEEILTTSPHRILKRILMNLTYLDFFNLSLVSTNLKDQFSSNSELCETILERYLGSIGYQRRTSSQKMTESISLKDLQSFYTGLEFGSEEIEKLSREMMIKAGRGIDKSMVKMIKDFTRSFNRILIHIREFHSVKHDHSNRLMKNGVLIHLGNRIESIWKIGRSAVLRVWVPTRESWMSNEEVVECERELWRSQVWPWLRKGDICWNTGLGEFANEGKLIFDGKYLRDLSFEFDSIGHLPSWLNMMSFPPVYYHRIIESSTASPIFYLDLSKFGKDVQSTMRLCKDQIEMSSPMTRYRVQRWVYRAMIEIQPGMNLSYGKREMVDLGWCGRIVLEVEGTSECARELLKRCSKEWSVEIEKKSSSFSGSIHLTPWRIIREKSGPGKMWIRPVLDDERI